MLQSRSFVFVAVLVVAAACENPLEPLLPPGDEPLVSGGGVGDPAIGDSRPPGDDPDGPADVPPDVPPDGPPPPPLPPPPSPPPPPPPPDEPGDGFDDAPEIVCGQRVSGSVGSEPVWYRLNSPNFDVTLTLDADGGADLDLHVTDGPNVPGDVIAQSESPTGHEQLQLSDVGPVGVRVILYGGAPSSNFMLVIDCDQAPVDPPPDNPPGGDPPAGGEPPADLACINYQERNSRNPTGNALRDIVQHLPNDQVDYYCDPDLITCAHEVSHGIHAELRNYFNPTSQRSNAFYILQDRACFVAEPDILKHDATPFVPAALHEFRFETYVSGQDAWDDTPLYLWDEWNAYVNGGEAALSLFDEGNWHDGWRDQSGVIEFVAYGVAVGMAVEDRDSAYLSTAQGTQFKAMMAYLTKRSLDLHRFFASNPDFQSSTSDALYNTLRNGSGGASIRSFLVRIYGQAWVDEAFAF